MSATHVQDQLMMLKLSLEEAGHEAVFAWEPSSQGINIAVELFTEDQARSLASHGERTIVVATEFAAGGTFNDMAGDQKTGHYGRRWYWDQRASTFRIVAAAAKAVWCLDQGQLSGYRAFLNPRKVHQLPFAYLPEYAQVRHVAPARKDIDVLFTGSLTTYRREQLARIAARGLAVEVLGPQAPAYLREHFVGRAKLNVHIRQSPTWKYPSNCRLYYAIMNAAPMLSERCAESSDLETFVTLAQPGALADECHRLLAGGDLLEQALTRRERFRDQRPAAEAMRCLLEATFGDRPGADSCRSQRSPTTRRSGSVWNSPLAPSGERTRLQRRLSQARWVLARWSH
jgi:hypothetical protein